MIEAGNREHPRGVQERGGDQGSRRKPDPEHAKAGDMEAKERQRPEPVDAVINSRIDCSGLNAGIEPAQYRGQRRTLLSGIFLGHRAFHRHLPCVANLYGATG